MPTPARQARECFEHNRDRNTHDPEKYDLYVGLYNLAVAIERLTSDVYDLKRKVDSVENKVR
jgi:hypothetical protein